MLTLLLVLAGLLVVGAIVVVRRLGRAEVVAPSPSTGASGTGTNGAPSSPGDAPEITHNG